MTHPTKYDDYIYSYSVIRAIEDLQCDREYCDDAALDGINAEYDALLDLQQQCEGCYYWEIGSTMLIRHDCFRRYAHDLVGTVDPHTRWPSNHIEWRAAIDELKQSYTKVDFDGVEYYVRSKNNGDSGEVG